MVSGLAVKIPRTKKIFTNPIFIYKKKDKLLVDSEIASLKAKYPRIEMERFEGTANYPVSFAPTGIYGLTRGYLAVSLRKIANKMEKEDEKAAEKADEEQKKKKSRSKSPPTALRREVATSVSAGRRSSSK